MITTSITLGIVAIVATSLVLLAAYLRFHRMRSIDRAHEGEVPVHQSDIEYRDPGLEYD